MEGREPAYERGKAMPLFNAFGKRAPTHPETGDRLPVASRSRTRMAVATGSMALVLGLGSGILTSTTAQAQTSATSANSSTWTSLTLQNGWTNGPFGTSVAAARTVSGIVHLKGAIATTGTNPVPFTLPAAFRPAAVAFVPVDLCNATNGRLQIEPTGIVTVQAEGGAFSNAACFTSLDGASFARTASSFTCLLYTSPSPRDGLLSRMPSSA